MRSSFRSFLAALSLALLALPAFAGAALAAPGSGASSKYVIDDAWCFPASEPDYCFTMKGRFTFVANGDTAITTGTIRHYTAAYDDGVLVSETFAQTVDQWRTIRDGSPAILQIEHTRYVSADETCVATAVLRIDDHEVVVDHWEVNCH